MWQDENTYFLLAIWQNLRHLMANVFKWPVWLWWEWKELQRLRFLRERARRSELANCFPESESIGTYSSVFLFQSSQYKDFNNSQYIRRFLLSSLVIYSCEYGEKELPQPSYSLSHFPSSCWDKGWKTMASKPNLGHYLSNFLKLLEQFKRRLFCCI